MHGLEEWNILHGLECKLEEWNILHGLECGLEEWNILHGLECGLEEWNIMIKYKSSKLAAILVPRGGQSWAHFLLFS